MDDRSHAMIAIELFRSLVSLKCIRGHKSAPLVGVALLIHLKARSPAVIMPVIAHHGDCLLHEGRPRHRAIKHDVLLLIHFVTSIESADESAQASTYQVASKGAPQDEMRRTP